MKEPKIHDSRKISNKEIVNIRGVEYWEITFEDGEKILIKWNETERIQITSKFTQDAELEKMTVEKLREMLPKALISSLLYKN